MADVILRGHPDWNPRPAQGQAGVQSADLELASRLCWPLSPLIYGELVFHEDFESPALHYTTETGAGVVHIGFEPRYANSGSRSLAMWREAGEGALAKVKRILPMLWSEQVGMGCYYALEGDAGAFSMYLRRVYEEWVRTIGLYVDVATPKLMVWGAVEGVAAWRDVTDLVRDDLELSDFQFMQMVADFDAETYARVIHGAEVFDVSYDIPAAVHANASNYYQVEVRMAGTGDNDLRVLVDDILVTRAEYIPA